MEVKRQSKRLHRHAGPLAAIGLALAIGVAGLVAVAPDFAAHAAHSLVSSNVQVKTGHNGLAEVHFADWHPKNTPPNLGAASQAGQRLHNQLLFESSANK